MNCVWMMVMMMFEKWWVQIKWLLTILPSTNLECWCDSDIRNMHAISLSYHIYHECGVLSVARAFFPLLDGYVCQRYDVVGEYFMFTADIEPQPNLN